MRFGDICLEWTTISKMKLAIVIPAYNEERRIGKTLDAFITYYNTRKGVKTKIWVIINNTRDKTLEIVQSYKKKYPHKIDYLNLIKGGKGYAVIEGFKCAYKEKYDLIGFVDADLATSPLAFDDLIHKRGKAEGVIASRYLPGSRCTPTLTFRRAVVGKLFNTFTRLLLHLPESDTQCGAKVFSKRAIAHIISSVKVTQWAFDIELLYECHQAGFTIKEVPTTWIDIEGSKVKLVRTSIQMFFAVIQLRLKKSPLHCLLTPLKKQVLFIWKIVQ
ncbi:glycosyltransferase [Candidatus Pacearchaeota archaeon]|nr:glycosyltransferase [Candidatus Pacearchaeota archaeon]